MRFGKKLKELRRQKGLTLKALGDVIGSSKGYLSGIEHGKVNPPSDKFVRRIARTVGIAEEDLLRLAYYDKVPQEVKTEFRTLNAPADGGTGRESHRRGLLPLLNSESTGYPLVVGDHGLPIALVTEYCRIPGVADSRAFAVTVCGDDMAVPGAGGIRAGDIVVATADRPVRSGDTAFVVFSTSEGKAAHLRKVTLEGKNNVLLHPLNPVHPMHILTRDDIDGLYRVVARIERFGIERTAPRANARC